MRAWHFLVLSAGKPRVLRNSFVLVFMGYRTIIASYDTEWGIAHMCLCETKCRGRWSIAPFWGRANLPKKASRDMRCCSDSIAISRDMGPLKPTFTFVRSRGARTRTCENKGPQNGEKIEKGAQISSFRSFWAIFSPFRAVGHFAFFRPVFPIFGFRPIFHSMPGGLTRNLRGSFFILRECRNGLRCEWFEMQTLFFIVVSASLDLRLAKIHPLNSTGVGSSKWTRKTGNRNLFARNRIGKRNRNRWNRFSRTQTGTVPFS